MYAQVIDDEAGNTIVSASTVQEDVKKGLTKTNNVQELAELYSISSVYANLSYEENYPTTNLEATACGTPVVTYRTGGSPESCRPENVVEQGNLEELIAVIKRICE
jgi:glycosyltransferase involved in cell wall biosynthesis